MLYCRKREIKVLIKSVQQQRNYADCGVFSIAFATSLEFGDRSEEVIYDSKIMRQHLFNCLRKMRMERFDGHRHGDIEDTMFLVVEEQDSSNFLNSAITIYF